MAHAEPLDRHYLAFVRLMDLVVVLLYLSVVMLVAGLCEADGCPCCFIVSL